MASINSGRVWIGTLAGGVVWTIWTMVVNMVFLASRYEAGQAANLFLKEPHYSYFLPVWILTLFVLTFFATRIYAMARGAAGAGPGTALKVGAIIGFTAGFPLTFSIAAWMPIDRFIPLFWMLDLWVGAILATLIAAWLYKD